MDHTAFSAIRERIAATAAALPTPAPTTEPELAAWLKKWERVVELAADRKLLQLAGLDPGECGLSPTAVKIAKRVLAEHRLPGTSIVRPNQRDLMLSLDWGASSPKPDMSPVRRYLRKISSRGFWGDQPPMTYSAECRPLTMPAWADRLIETAEAHSRARRRQGTLFDFDPPGQKMSAEPAPAGLTPTPPDKKCPAPAPATEPAPKADKKCPLSTARKRAPITYAPVIVPNVGPDGTRYRPFPWLWAFVQGWGPLTPTQRLVGILVLIMADRRTGFCWAERRTMADLLGHAGTQHVDSAVARLVEAGFLQHAADDDHHSGLQCLVVWSTPDSGVHSRSGSDPLPIREFPSIDMNEEKNSTAAPVMNPEVLEALHALGLAGRHIDRASGSPGLSPKIVHQLHAACRGKLPVMAQALTSGDWRHLVRVPTARKASSPPTRRYIDGAI